MATVNKSYFNKLNNLLSPKQEQDPSLRGKSQNIDFEQKDNPNPDEFTKTSGGNAFKAIAEANKNVDQSQLVQQKKDELGSGVKKLADDVNNQFTSFQNQNKFDNTLDDGEVENLITDQDRAQTDWTQLQTANQNTFKDSVNENAFDESIANLNQSTDQFLDPSQSQGNKALDAYLLNQSGALNKARNDLIQQASQAKTQVKSFRDQSGSVVEGFEEARKAELERVKNVLKEKMKGVDDVATANALAKKQEMQKSDPDRLLAARNDLTSKAAELQQQLDGTLASERKRILALDRNNFNVDAMLEGLNQDYKAKKANLDAGIMNALRGVNVSIADTGIGDKFYTDNDSKRFNKLAALLGVGDNRAASIAGQMKTSSNMDQLFEGLRSGFQTAKVGDISKPKDSSGNVEKGVSGNPLIDPRVAMEKQAEANNRAIEAAREADRKAREIAEKNKETVVSGGMNKVADKVKKKFKW
jgi:hypothetical protein